MTTTTEPRTRRRAKKEQEQQTPRATQPAAVLPPTRGRRRPMIIAIGVALAIVGGLASWWMLTTSVDTQTVFVAKSTIDRGEEITAKDLTTIEIAGGQNTSAISATNSEKVVGKTSSVVVPAGSMITEEAVNNQVTLADDKSLVGLAFKTGQLPNKNLAPGDTVRIVDTPVAQGDPPSGTPQSFKATVYATKYDQGEKQWIIDVQVDKNVAADVAARSTTGRIALILDPDQEQGDEDSPEEEEAAE